MSKYAHSASSSVTTNTDGLLCIFLVEDVGCSGDIFVDPWGRCNPQQIDDLQATGHIQNGREQIYLSLSSGATIECRPPSNVKLIVKLSSGKIPMHT